LIKSQRELQVFLRRAPIDLLTIPGEDTSLTASINQLLQPRANDVLKLPNSDQLAKQLNISEQTLRRKLSSEGINYQQIKDNLRNDLAQRLLNNRNLKIADIAKQLNFSEPRAFTRAFKQWTGLTPREYRQERFNREQV